MATKMVEEDPGHQSAISEKISKSDDSGNTIMTGTDDSWPFSDATDGSFRVSWLAELFGRLGIADIIASASLENENQEDLKERKFITRTEPRAFSSSYNGPPACPELKTAQQHSFTRNFSSQDHNPGFYQSFWIPLSEIDVFPMSGTLMAVARRVGLNHSTQ
ncbi:hypothetical protein DID88_002690 [Monilinia fructigena]|uniref:Uncharacterized protein n=1 Tax=Monilinia fructigena TaxID=38457 RepID=A0A395IQ37_9HELO|nr:hypothetical protein DID88_002690 [Monilinia fructigena]